MPRGVPLQLKGERFGKWTVIGDSGYRDNSGTVLWDCVCDCGRRSEIPTGNLRQRLSTKCLVCARRELIERRTKHGGSASSLYQVWMNRVKGDCVSEWQEFGRFRDGVYPRSGRILSKLDDSQPFGPNNFEWTKYLPARRELEVVGGVALSQSRWAEKLGISKERVRQLVASHGSLEAALQRRADAISMTLGQLIEVHAELDFNELFCARSGGRPCKYPWDQWSDGNEHRIKEGVDFEDLIAVRNAIYAYAKRAGVKVWSRRDPDDKKVLRFRFTKGKD